MTRQRAAVLVLVLSAASWAQGDKPADAPPAPPAPETAPASPAPAPAPAPVAAPAVMAAPAPAPAPAVDNPAHPNAGYANDVFFLRDSDDNFAFIPSGRFQMDWFGYEGGSKEPPNGFLPKRVRLEAFGTLMRHFDFQMGAELANSTTPILTDNYITANYTPFAQLQVGQFDAPFTMENRTSDKYTDLQERSTPVRAFAIPENKQIGAMVFGQPGTETWAYWSLGVFNGEGLQVFPHKSDNFDVMGRAWVAPGGIAGIDFIKNVWVGGSFWEGNRAWGRDPTSVSGQLDRLAMKDSAGFTFFSPSAGSTHLGDFGQLNKYAVELNAPIGPFVLKGEYISLSEGTREVTVAGGTTSAGCGGTRTDCTGLLSGNAWYLRLSYFVWGDPLINGRAGEQNVPHVWGQLRPNKTGDALQLVAEWDRTQFTYAANDGSSASADPLVGGYSFGTVAFGANYWATRRVRITANFLYNSILGPGPRPQITTPNNNSYEFSLRGALVL